MRLDRRPDWSNWHHQGDLSQQDVQALNLQILPSFRYFCHSSLAEPVRQVNHLEIFQRHLRLSRGYALPDNLLRRASVT